MPVGFETYDSNGVVQINSNNRVPKTVKEFTAAQNEYFDDVVAGAYAPILQDQSGGSSWRTAYVSNGPSDLLALKWVSCQVGRTILMGTRGTTPLVTLGSVVSAYNSVPSAATGVGRYLEVFDEQGSQVFTAEAVRDVPIIKQIVRIPAGTPYVHVGGGVYVTNLITVNTNMPTGVLPLILQNACNGEVEVNETAGQYWGPMFKTINNGAQIQCQLLHQYSW